ncbi:MAG TPA: sigma-70 family RNA polymerase sigma factor [Solirubrobacteraceae bacterium]|jgi:RNA polymerase sigma-70 factor (ECF subfamily)
MSSTPCTRPSDRIRHEADRIEAEGVRGRRFQRRRAAEAGDPGGGEHLTDSAVERARAGDQDAVRYLYLRYADNVYGYVCSMVRDEHEAEDVTQQIFAKVLCSLRRYQRREVPFSAWVLRIAHNTAIDAMRARRATPVAEVRGPAVAFDDIGRERRSDLRDALATLPDEQRDVLVLRFLCGLSPDEAADYLGRTVDAVHGLQHRARCALRVELVRTEAAPTARRS